MDLEKIWSTYQILIVAILTLFIAPLFWKIAGIIKSLFIKIIDKIGGRIGGKFSYRSFEKQYLNWVVTENKDLKLTGIVSFDDAKKPQLEQVFISLTMGKLEGKESEAKSIVCNARKSWWRRILLPLALKNNPKVNESMDWYKKVAEIIDDVRDHRLRGWPIRFILGIGKNEEISEGLSHLRIILRSYKYTAFLGGPGVGKTTLIQFIALLFARKCAGDSKLRRSKILKEQLRINYWCLPIIIKLRSIAGILLKSTQNNKDNSIVDTFVSILPPDLQPQYPPNYLIDRLKEGKCILLLDGLDEVVSHEEYEAIVRAIKSLMVMYPKNQLIITSRPAGWRGGIGTEFEVLNINELSDKEINKFIDSWYDAVERNAVVGSLEDEGSAERNARKRRAIERSSELKDALNNNISIRRLARNPLLLSIIALVHRSLATLPKERAKLYAECSKLLLEQWDISKGVHVDDTNLKLSQKEAIMRRIAYAFHTGEIGEKTGGREAKREQVERLVAEMLSSMGQAPENSHKLLQRLIERSGLIAEQQRDVLIFAHLTLQEYFTAQALAKEQVKANKIFSNSENLLSDWWREVVLLYAGLISDASVFIEHIYSPQKDIFYRPRLRLAGMCLAESVEVKNSNLRQKIGMDLLDVYTMSKIKTATDSFPIQIIHYLIEWSRDSIWYEYVGISGIDNLSCNKELLEHTIDELTIILDMKEANARLTSIAILGLLGPKACRNSILDKLINMLESNEVFPKLIILETLTKMCSEKNADRVINAIIPLLEENDEMISFASANALTELLKVSSNLKLFIDNLWLSFDKIMKKQNELDLKYKNILHKHLKRNISNFPFFYENYFHFVDENGMTEKDRGFLFEDLNYFLFPQSYYLSSNYRFTYQYMLSKNIYTIESKLQTGVLQKLIKAHNLKVLNSNVAGWVLVKLAHENQQYDIHSRFFSMVNNSDYSIRVKVLWSLVELGKEIYTEKVVKIITLLLLDENKIIQQAAAIAICYLGEKGITKVVVDNLLPKLKSKNIEIRCFTILALSSIKEENIASKVIPKLVLMLYDSNPRIRSVAFYTIGKIGKRINTSQVIKILLSVIKIRRRKLCILALNEIANIGENAAIPEVLNCLLFKLKDKHESVKAAAIGAFRELGHKAITSEVIDNLLMLLRDRKHNVLRVSIIALGYLVKKEKIVEVIDSLFSILYKNYDGEIQQTIFNSIKLLAIDAKSYIIEKLLKLLDSDKIFIRTRSLIAIAEIGKDENNIMLRDKLRKSLREKDIKVCSAALNAIQILDNKLIDEQIINEILTLLQNNNIKENVYKTLETLYIKAGKWSKDVSN